MPCALHRRLYIDIHTYTTYTYTHMYICTSTYTCTHMYIHTYIDTYICREVAGMAPREDAVGTASHDIYIHTYTTY